MGYRWACITDHSFQGFYTVYRHVFEAIINEDAPFMEDQETEIKRIPTFGDSKSSYDEVRPPSSPKTLLFPVSTRFCSRRLVRSMVTGRAIVRTRPMRGSINSTFDKHQIVKFFEQWRRRTRRSVRQRGRNATKKCG